ncbi:hypothetical protein HN419_07580 [Candidatus Woesearchaeota archaeon]|jgi:hypothetical protein|nr:hypothetical protein [Candidatus Woesearchaeota archaeon]MBT3538354.1 hypothetical protein [Candidatus Woesearchaeota archaeon]MBT4698331.1 hypothetical protein [Candidatus Woesearchaeota archaeon]MBT4716770.1 hypothetical protein [Candidatus Woesearchaeota archaeon]MBT7106023.1 hypothetical protein [Candidatus Woesearchaeota archaeon]
MGEQPSRQELTDLLDRIERRLTPELDSNDSRIIRVRATDFRIKDGGSLERWYVVPNGFWGRVADEFQRIVTFDDSPDLGIAYSARDNGRLNITTRMRYRNGRALVRTARAELVRTRMNGGTAFKLYDLFNTDDVMELHREVDALCLEPSPRRPYNT